MHTYSYKVLANSTDIYHINYSWRYTGQYRTIQDTWLEAIIIVKTSIIHCTLKHNFIICSIHGGGIKQQFCHIFTNIAKIESLGNCFTLGDLSANTRYLIGSNCYCGYVTNNLNHKRQLEFACSPWCSLYTFTRSCKYPGVNL